MATFELFLMTLSFAGDMGAERVYWGEIRAVRRQKGQKKVFNTKKYQNQIVYNF